MVIVKEEVFQIKDLKYAIFSIFFLFFLSALMMLKQLMVAGYFCCHIQDTHAFTSRGWQFVEALKEGIIYPRWAHLNFWGYGSPAFILYPPFGYYVAAFFNLFTVSVIKAMNITKFVALFFSGIGMFFLVREFYSERIALLTASFYVIYPYNIFQFYLMGTFYSITSLIWFAPIILFTYRYLKKRRFKDVIYAGLCYGGLILSHLINAYMFTFVLIAFVLYMSIVNKRLQDVMIIPLIIMVGFLISAVYTFPVIFEKQFVHIKEFIGEGSKSNFNFDFHNFFILPKITSKFSSDHWWNELYHIFVFHVSLFCILIVLYFSQIFKLKKIVTMQNANYINKFFLGTALFTIFLLFGISAFVWETIPFFEYIQFPHRWLNITTFTTVFLVSFIFWVIGNIYKKKKERMPFLTILFLICITSLTLDYKYIRIAPVINEKDLIPIKTPDWYKVDLPASVDIDKIDKHDKSVEKVAIVEGEGMVVFRKWKSAERIIEILAQQPLIARIRTFNFPGWKAFIDGKQKEIKTEEGVGAMLIDIPEGRHTLVLKFGDTPIRYYSKIVSLVSFLFLIFLAIFTKKRCTQCKNDKVH